MYEVPWVVHWVWVVDGVSALQVWESGGGKGLGDVCGRAGALSTREGGLERGEKKVGKRVARGKSRPTI